jgi:hypothetical protein
MQEDKTMFDTTYQFTVKRFKADDFIRYTCTVRTTDKDGKPIQLSQVDFPTREKAIDWFYEETGKLYD